MSEVASRSGSTTGPRSSPDGQGKYNKRAKSDQQLLNRPLQYEYYPNNKHGSEHQMMSFNSKSILDQLNQTEKRYLPPDSSSVSSAAKRTKMLSSPRRSGTTRKRKGWEGFGLVENEEDIIDDPRAKTAKFCHCNECYAEAAGIPMDSPPRINDSSIPAQTPKKVTFDENSITKKTKVATMSDKSTEMEYVESIPQIIVR